jgi:hypothetical protein
MIFVPQDIIFSSIQSFDTQHILNCLVMDSDDMLSQVILVHCPSSASDDLLCFLLVLVDSSQIATIPQTGNILNHWIVC